MVGANIESVVCSLIDVLRKNQVVLNRTFENSVPDIARELSQADIISDSVRKSPTYDTIIGDFISGLQLKSDTIELEEFCMDFLKALSNVGGPVSQAANMLMKKWMKETDLQIENYRKRPRKE